MTGVILLCSICSRGQHNNDNTKHNAEILKSDLRVSRYKYYQNLV